MNQNFVYRSVPNECFPSYSARLLAKQSGHTLELPNCFDRESIYTMDLQRPQCCLKLRLNFPPFYQLPTAFCGFRMGGLVAFFNAGQLGIIQVLPTKHATKGAYAFIAQQLEPQSGGVDKNRCGCPLCWKELWKSKQNSLYNVIDYN